MGMPKNHRSAPRIMFSILEAAETIAKQPGCVSSTVYEPSRAISLPRSLPIRATPASRRSRKASVSN